MWIKDKYGNAVNSNHIITIRCDDDKAPFRVYAWVPDYAGECDNGIYLTEFETRAEAKDYINELIEDLKAYENLRFVREIIPRNKEGNG